jgi:prepilin-type N-terminal cleavage/methylation domain-containing protein
VCRAQSGFTLIELLIAMTLAALIVALGADILRTGMDFYQRAHLHIRQQQEMRGFFRLLRLELQGGLQKTAPLSGQQDWLAYSTANLPQGIGWPGKTPVRLSCRVTEDGHIELVHGIQLTQAAIANKLSIEPSRAGSQENPAATATSEANEVAPYQEETLVHGLTACAFSFLIRIPAPDSPQPTAVWVEEWLEGKGLPSPLAVRVQLTLPGGALPPVVIPL